MHPGLLAQSGVQSAREFWPSRNIRSHLLLTQRISAVVSLFVVLLFATAIVSLVRAGRQAPAPSPFSPLASLNPHALPDISPATTKSRTFIGVVLPFEALDVIANVDAHVDEIHVRTGDRVSRGSLIAVLDLAAVRADLKMAEAELRTAEADAQRAAVEFAQAGSRVA